MILNEKSRLTLNATVNVLRGIMSIIFSLITFPYVSRVLGVEQLGRYNFANSIVSYFMLIAGLGVNAYAIREGTQKRANREEFNTFAKEIFTINIIATIVAYLLLLILYSLSSKIQDYSSLIWILSIAILLQTLGVDWIYSAYEKYVYLAVRSFMFQLCALALMFLFVHSYNDLKIYALITLVSSGGANIINFFCSRKYCRLRLIFNCKLLMHLKPIFVLFSTAITITIYVSSDITILGFLSDDYEVGLYSVSVKIYTIMKTVVSSFLVVFIPQISLMIAEDNRKALFELCTNIWKNLITIIIPTITGIIVMSKEIIILVSGYDFFDAHTSLVILGLSLFFCMGAYFWGQCILIPFKKEKKLFYITILSALINVTLNFLLIPVFGQNGAAITTILAEAVVFFCCLLEGKKHINLSGIWSLFFKPLCGSIAILLIGVIGGFLIENYLIRLVVVIVFSVMAYFVIEIALKNEAIYDIIRILKRRGK